MWKVIFVFSLLWAAFFYWMHSADEFVQSKISNEELTSKMDVGNHSPSMASRAVLLDKSCASCHRSTLKTAVPGAIAFYDLDLGEDWIVTPTEELVTGFQKRLPDMNEFSDSEKQTILDFVAALDTSH